MKVALLLDHDWLRQEAPTLRRFAIGLVGEQVAAFQLCPDYWADDEAEHQLPITGRKLPYTPSRFNWLTNRRITRLAAPLETEEIDAVHALDANLQHAAARLAIQLNAALLIEVWSADQAHTAAQNPLPTHPPSTSSEPTPPVVLAAATEPLAQRCRAAVGKNAHVTTVKPGVYRLDQPTHQHPLSQPDRSVGCVVIGNGLYDQHYHALIDALATIAAQHKQLFFFFYNTGYDTHRLWQAVEKAGLSGRSSFIPYEPASRQLILQADLIIQPQPLGRVRSLILDAMAAARPTLATQDHLLDYLIPDKTALLIEQPNPDHWTDRINHILKHPQQWIELGQSARAYVHENHTASGYLGRILELYRQFAAPTPIAFHPNAPAPHHIPH